MIDKRSIGKETQLNEKNYDKRDSKHCITSAVGLEKLCEKNQFLYILKFTSVYGIKSDKILNNRHEDYCQANIF